MNLKLLLHITDSFYDEPQNMLGSQDLQSFVNSKPFIEAPLTEMNIQFNEYSWTLNAVNSEVGLNYHIVINRDSTVGNTPDPWPGIPQFKQGTELTFGQIGQLITNVYNAYLATLPPVVKDSLLKFKKCKLSKVSDDGVNNIQDLLEQGNRQYNLSDDVHVAIATSPGSDDPSDTPFIGIDLNTSNENLQVTFTEDSKKGWRVLYIDVWNAVGVMDHMPYSLEQFDNLLSADEVDEDEIVDLYNSVMSYSAATSDAADILSEAKEAVDRGSKKLQFKRSLQNDEMIELEDYIYDKYPDKILEWSNDGKMLSIF